MDKVLFKKYGTKEALLAWIGPSKADQDFVFPNYWYEIKTTVSGSEALRISSVEQLDVETDGELVVIYLDTTSQSDVNKISLNSLVDKVLKELSSYEEQRIFGDILIEQGYIHKDEYDDYVFRYSGTVRYAVTSTFPALRRDNIPYSVINANYTISLASISEYIKEE